MADRFYTPEPLAPGEFLLTGPEAHHLTTVRRFTAGDRVALFNGDGAEYVAEIRAIARKAVVLHIVERRTPARELGVPLVVASALPKGDRADFLIEKLTELGVTRFIPLLTERAIVRPKESAAAKFARAAIEASKQCGRNVLMAVEAPASWPELLSRPDLPADRFVLHPGPTALAHFQARTGAVVAIGPEGGFAEGELEQARNAGWQFLSLGPRILRVETAALAAAALLGQAEALGNSAPKPPGFTADISNGA